MPGSLSVVGRLAALTMMLAACQGEGPVGEGNGPDLAKGGTAADPAVTATDPSSAPQDTTLDLRVLGGGFDRGSTVELKLDGNPVTTVRTNSTRYVKATELVANITIALEAVATTYDVAVTTSTGRKGIGTEMFAVRIKGNTDLDSRATWYFFAKMSDGTTDTRLYGDGRGMDGAASTVVGESAYPGETCGVRGKLFNSASYSNSGDAVFSPAFTPDNTACGTRRLTVAFPGGSPIAFNSFTNAQNVWYQTELATVGGSFVENMGFGTSGVAMPCGTKDVVLRYLPADGSGVRVTRLADQGAARTWRVESSGDHTAGCWATVKGKRVLKSTHYLPFHALIVEVPAPAGGW